ncbi:MAG: nucleotidyltransferase family protein [Oscillospiraceae bacterium]|nr:nucleotidyltransferase family protein [Oscillospiraceae bacterium]
MDTNPSPLRIGCVVMAAGNASRFGANKLSATVGGKKLIVRALEALPRELLDRICVVTQYDEVERIARGMDFACIHNDHPDWGVSHTIYLGTQALMEQSDAILYLVADQPLLRRESVARELDLFRQHPERIVAMSHDGVRGNPCIFPKRFFPELCALSGDVGGSAVIRRHANDLQLFEVDARELADVDTPQTLHELNEEA